MDRKQRVLLNCENGLIDVEGKTIPLEQLNFRRILNRKLNTFAIFLNFSDV